MLKSARVMLIGAVKLAALVALAAGLCTTGYVLVRGELREAVYRDRLESLAADYHTLHDRYAHAVARTAVTELVVRDRAISVRVAAADGSEQLIPTPFDASREIYADYAVIDGRIVLRRIFDEQTPPSQALVIEPELTSIDWDAAPTAVGKAVYRSLSDGRWSISVTGNGSLGLTRLPDDRAAPLAPAPDLEPHEDLLEDIQRDAARVGWSDVLNWLAHKSGLTPRSSP